MMMMTVIIVNCTLPCVRADIVMHNIADMVGWLVGDVDVL